MVIYVALSFLRTMILARHYCFEFWPCDIYVELLRKSNTIGRSYPTMGSWFRLRYRLGDLLAGLWNYWMSRKRMRHDYVIDTTAGLRTIIPRATLLSEGELSFLASRQGGAED
jgi:hypothetical protein